MTRELQPCPQYLFLKVLSKTRSPIIFITKRILRQVSSVVTKSLSVCFHTKTDVDFVSYRRERMIQYSFKIEMHSHFVFRTAKYSKKRLQQNPVRNVFGSGGCQLFRHVGGLGAKNGLIFQERINSSFSFANKVLETHLGRRCFKDNETLVF